MTENKPIIIDGVDVSGCDYFCFTKKQECYANDNDCNKSPNCHFKQLTRKTQECQQLINKNNHLEEELNATKLLLEGKNNQYAAKTQECEMLKKELDKVYEDIKLSPLCYKCSEEDCLRKEIDQLKEENEGLKDDIKGLKINLLDKENRSARYYLITSHREWNEMYKKFGYQRDKKEQAKQKLKRIRDIVLNEYSNGNFNGKEVTKILQIIDEVE